MKSIGRTVILAAVTLHMLGSTASAEEWIAMAIRSWQGSDGHAHAAAGFSGTQYSKSAAIEAARAQCESKSYGRECHVHGPWNEGCIYATLGKDPKSAGVWMGATIEESVNDCEAENSNCQAPIGGCVNN